MRPHFRFEDLEIWQLAKLLAADATGALPFAPGSLPFARSVFLDDIPVHDYIGLRTIASIKRNVVF